ncbi:TPA: right-handed parallel beta-helix repeat-containing protein, partial [Klebsiella pneumoniae]|nr:right-handed parallel beta-helix repeat-containing protein [Klebsiella pneumoniae]
MAEVPLPTPTQAPVPSTDIRNAVFAGAKLDEEVTGTGEFYTDRLGVKRLTNTGRNNQFDAAQLDRANRFEQFLLSSGYVFLGDYEDGPFQFSARNQYIRYDNQYYRLNAATDVGFTTTGTDATSFANDVTHFVLMDGDTLRQNLGSSDGANLIGGLPFVTPEMFGSSRGDITHDEALRLAMAAAAVHPTRTLWMPADYEFFDTHIPPEGLTIIIDGVAKHNPVGDFTWSESNRRSPYSFLLVTEKNVNIKGSGRIENKYEAVSADAGGDNFKFEGVTVSNPNRSKSVGLSIYNIINASVLNCTIANNGSKGTYIDNTSAGITGRYGNGIDFGGIWGMTVQQCTLVDNGGNGAWCYGVGDLTIQNNWCITNG